MDPAPLGSASLANVWAIVARLTKKDLAAAGIGSAKAVTEGADALVWIATAGRYRVASAEEAERIMLMVEVCAIKLRLNPIVLAAALAKAGRKAVDGRYAAGTLRS